MRSWLAGSLLSSLGSGSDGQRATPAPSERGFRFTAPSLELLFLANSQDRCAKAAVGPVVSIASPRFMAAMSPLHCEYVENLAVGKNIAFKALDDLMYSDSGPASVLFAYCKRFDMRIKLGPLSSPIRADFFFSHNLAALRSLGPAHIFRHQRQCTVDVQLVECGIRLLNNGLKGLPFILL